MPITNNVEWDALLETFKGRDTTHYVSAVAAIARSCAVCGSPVGAGDALSLIVDITTSIAPDGGQKRLYTDNVCHRQCSAPVITVRESEWKPEEVSPIAARTLITTDAGPLNENLPVLAITLFPALTIREKGGEQTSFLVALLLVHGFRLAPSADYTEILNTAEDVDDSCTLTVTPEGLISLDLTGTPICRMQLELSDPEDADWLRAADKGPVLVLGGDNIIITDTTLDIAGAATMGTLVAGTVHGER
jgi:hypothetical protein